MKIYLAYSAPFNGEWRRRGWRTIEAGECNQIGRLKKGLIYLYGEAEGRRRYWRLDR